MAKNKSSLEKDKKKKVPFNVLSKKGLMTIALAGVMAFSPLMLAGCSNGQDGKDGSTWFSDSGDPSANLGNIGDFYMDKENYNIFEKQSSGWVFVVNIKEKEPDMLYYADITNAMNAINNKTYDDMSLRVNEEQANVGITLINDIPQITLLNDLTLSETMSITNDMILDLQGKVLTFSTNVGIEVLSGNLQINGSETGSKIYISSNDVSTTAIKVVSGECSIVGGLYQSYSTAIGTSENPNSFIIVEENGKLSISDAEIIAQDETTGTINAISINRGGEANITNCDIKAVSPNGLRVCGILNNGVSVVCKSDIVAKSNYTANAEGTAYGSTSTGVTNNAILTLKDCYVAGTLSGMNNSGIVYVDGGVYEGYGHGGIYFYGGNKTSYVKNASIRQCTMFDGFYADDVVGTNHSGMYVGAGNNMKIYMDNCEFSGIYYPFVMKSNCSGNELYVSNSNINLDCERYIRLDTEDNKLFIGIGNNFNISEHTSIEAAATLTEEDYLFYFPIY